MIDSHPSSFNYFIIYTIFLLIIFDILNSKLLLFQKNINKENNRNRLSKIINKKHLYKYYYLFYIQW